MQWLLRGKGCETGNKMMHFVSGDKLVLNQELGNSVYVPLVTGSLSTTSLGQGQTGVRKRAGKAN